MAELLLQGGAGFFEITDHTTASDWERFIANLEDILTEWKLNKQSSRDRQYRELPAGAISKGIWHEKSDTIRFGNVTFGLNYQYLSEFDRQGASNFEFDNNDSDSEFHDADNIESHEELSNKSDFSRSEDEGSLSDNSSNIFSKNTIPIEEEKEHGEYELPERLPECLRDLINTNNDFASKAHCLVRWYNLRRFIILTPRGDTIISEDRLKLVLSSASIAQSNIDCQVPIFLQIRNPRNNFYQGISEHFNIRTTYEMIFLKKAVKQYSYLSDLISMFREKTGSTLNDPITATIRLNYCLDFFDLFLSQEEVFTGIEYDRDEDEEAAAMRLKELRNRKRAEGGSKSIPQDMRSGATFEQVREVLEDNEDCLPHPYKILKFIHIAALWLPVSDKVITDSQVHSDLDPAEAPIWTMRGITSDYCNWKIIHETQAFFNLLSAAVDYAYDKLDGDATFNDFTRESLKKKCLKLCYDLSTQPEVVLSTKPTDSIRKLIALLFHRAFELTTSDGDALSQIAGQLKKQPSLCEIYRNFARKNRPSVKEFIIRTQISRPFNPLSSPALPQRMFCTICDEEFRLCGSFSEFCN